MEFQEDRHIRVYHCVWLQRSCSVVWNNFPLKGPTVQRLCCFSVRNKRICSVLNHTCDAYFFYILDVMFHQLIVCLLFDFLQKNKTSSSKKKLLFPDIFHSQGGQFKPMVLKCACSGGDAKGTLAACLFEYWCISLQIQSLRNMLWIVTVQRLECL